MITFKSHSDLEKLNRDDPAYPVMDELVRVLIDDFTEPGQDYNAEDYGFLILVEPDDVDRELNELDMPRLADVLWEEPADLGKLLRVLKEHNPRNRVTRLVTLYLLSTGARLNEALQAKWKDVDRANKLWRIPATNSKSKKVRSVPLNASAIEVLDQLDTEGKHEYLFVNRDTQKPYTTIHKTWNRLRIKAGIPDFKIHSLRHQYASFLINSGRTLYEVQQILGHSDPSVTQRYAHLSTKSLQAAADSASDAINGAMPKSP